MNPGPTAATIQDLHRAGYGAVVIYRRGGTFQVVAGDTLGPGLLTLDQAGIAVLCWEDLAGYAPNPDLWEDDPHRPGFYRLTPTGLDHVVETLQQRDYPRILNGGILAAAITTV